MSMGVDEERVYGFALNDLLYLLQNYPIKTILEDLETFDKKSYKALLDAIRDKQTLPIMPK